MRTRTAITAVLLALVATTAACSSSDKPDLAACKAALEKQVKDLKGTQSKRPDACDGVDAKTMGQYSQEIFDDQTTK
jgi:Flp pilus assembly protein TadD